MKGIYSIIFSGLIFLIIISGCVNTSMEQYEKNKPLYQNVSVGLARELTLEAPIFILDVRPQEEYIEGHLKDAVLFPLQDLDNIEKINNMPKEKYILVYSSDERNSTLASEILIKNGFMNVYNMEDGIDAWIDAGYEVVK